MQRYKNILFVVTSNSFNEPALEQAVSLAQNNQASLTVVEVIDEIPPNTKLLERVLSPVDLQEKVVITYQNKLKQLIAPWEKTLEIQTQVLIGIPFLEIISEVLRNKRDLVIKASENGGLMDRMFGSDDMHLLRKCPCPVWLVKSKAPMKYKRILAAVDVDKCYPAEELETRHLLNLKTLEMATSLALSEFAELHVVYAWESIEDIAMKYALVGMLNKDTVVDPGEIKKQYRRTLDGLIDNVLGKLGQGTEEFIKPKIHLLKGSPRKEIPSFVNESKIDLVVMGTVARTGISGFFMGNTAETILNKLECPVLAIKPQGFVTPVQLD